MLNAYPIKDELKERGFHYRRDDYCWCIQYQTGDELARWFDAIGALCEENGLKFNRRDYRVYKQRQEVQAILVK